MVLESVTQPLATAVTTPVTYFVSATIFSMALYALMRRFEFPKTYSGIASILVSIFALEFILRIAFGFAGISLDFGTYPIEVPYILKTTISSGVMLMKFLDLVFNFGIVRTIGLPYYTEFLKTVPATMFPEVQLTAWTIIPNILSSLFNIFVFIYVSADSIIDFIGFYYFFAAIIIVVTDTLHKSTKNIKIYAAGLALIPVILYSYYISNPFSEYGKSVPELHKFFYFLENAPTTTQFIFLSTLIISFVIVMQILSMTIAFTYSAGAKTFMPGWETKAWEANTQGIGFLYTIAFAIMYAMHQYSWYVFFPAIALYSVFKNYASGTSTIVKQHQERAKMKEYFQDINGNDKTERLHVQDSDNSNTAIAFVGMVIIILSVLLARNLGLV